MKFRSTLLCAALGMTCLASAHADTLAKVRENGYITLAYRESSVPFSYLDAGKRVGMTVEMSEAIADAVKKAVGKPNLEVKWQAVTSQNRIPLLANGTIDLECGSTTNNSVRGKEVDFAINHFYTGTRLLVKKSAGVKNYVDLKGKTVAITSGTTNLQVMRKYSVDKGLELNIIMPKDHSDGFLQVQQDRAVAFGMDDVLLYGLMANAKNPSDYEVVADALQVEPYACMVRKNDPEFKKLVDGVIGGMMKSGAFSKLYDKWFLQPIPPTNTPLNMPMSDDLKKNLIELSDKPAT